MSHIAHYTAPEAWASYLINGDASGLRVHEQANADAWIASLGHGLPVDCEPAGFQWTHDAQAFAPGGGLCTRYAFVDNGGSDHE